MMVYYTSSPTPILKRSSELKMPSDYEVSLQNEITRLEKDKAALSAELNNSGGAEKADTSTQAIKKALLPKVPGYIRNINELADAADSESVMLQANKLLVEWAVTNKLDGVNPDADDDFKDLLNVIKAKAKAGK